MARGAGKDSSAQGAEVVERAISALNAERQKEALELIDRALEELSGEVEELVGCVWPPP